MIWSRTFKNIRPIYFNFVDCLVFIPSWYLYFIGNTKIMQKWISICFWGKCKVRYNCKCTIASSFRIPSNGKYYSVTIHHDSEFPISLIFKGRALQFNEVWILAHCHQLANPHLRWKQRPYLYDIANDNRIKFYFSLSWKGLVFMNTISWL